MRRHGGGGGPVLVNPGAAFPGSPGVTGDREMGVVIAFVSLVALAVWLIFVWMEEQGAAGRPSRFSIGRGGRFARGLWWAALVFAGLDAAFAAFQFVVAEGIGNPKLSGVYFGAAIGGLIGASLKISVFFLFGPYSDPERRSRLRRMQGELKEAQLAKQLRELQAHQAGG